MQSPNLNLDNDRAYYNNQTNNLPPKRRGRFLIWTGLAGIILGLAFLFSTAIAYKFYATSKKVITNGNNPTFIESMRDIASSNQAPLRGQERERLNILLVGLAGKNYPGANLTDSIILASINPKTYQTALLSVPRDLYVQIPDTRQGRGSPEAARSYTKINALYARSEDMDKSGKTGIDDLKEAVSQITGQPVDYYIALDFDGFKQIVNELDGMNIQVPKDIHDERYPGPNYSYQTFEISAGLQNLDGETALKYARTRHDEDGDFGRAFRQQQILEATRIKAYSLGTILNIPKMNEMLDTLGDHLRTDIQIDELNSFLDLIKKIDTHTTINKVLDAGKSDSLMAVSHVYLGGIRAFILIPRTGDYEEIQDIAKNIFDLEVIKRKQQEIKNENASVVIVNASGENGFDGKLNNLLKKFGYDVKIAPRQKISTTSSTIIYDLTNGLKPFSLEDLSKKLSAKIAANVPASLDSQCKEADFCVVAGSDIIDKLNYEENSVEDLEKGYDQQQIDEKGFIDLLKKGSSTKF